MQREAFYNPLDTATIGTSIATALLARYLEPLPPESFVGPGIYALYYFGDFADYQSLNDNHIYIGKSTNVYNRLLDHTTSLKQASNLNVTDFKCRYLLLDDIWLGLSETLLIQKFSPAWNVGLEGFGNHDPGKARYGGKKPAWDIVHPGRVWAERFDPVATLNLWEPDEVGIEKEA